MTTRTGSLSINSENMLPIIKKWLYSDHDIFAREVVANGCDAISKLHKLEIMGEYTYPEGHKDSITVITDPESKTLKFIDTGLGMTAEEVEEYITQIAFSGATAFLEKYKDKTNKDDIIGHFGLGFYSVFMVAENVEIDTLSYREGATPVHWECDGSSEYQIGDGTRTEVGTEITLHLGEDSIEFANKYRMQEVLEKYCSFMPVEIYLKNAQQEYETIDESDLRDTDVVVERIHEDAKYQDEYDEKGYAKLDENGNIIKKEISPARDRVKINRRLVSISDIHPLWTKHPNECTDEEYRAFYRKVFNDYREPLFWIHLNMDYPFNLKGIIYFPKINTEYDSIEGTIKLYNNQVFIADNIKEVIPEYMMLLKGVIDCPDFPLNVSRSALQNDGFVKKISDYISKKIADKLSGMCKTDRGNYEKYWDDISPFIKYGCLKDEKFNERMKDFMLYKDLEGKYLTLQEYLDKVADEGGHADSAVKSEELDIDEETTAEAKADAGADGSEPGEGAGDAAAAEADGDSAESVAGDSETAGEDSDTGEAPEEPKQTTVYYVTDEVQQSQYIKMFRDQGLDAVILRHNIDSAYISHVERDNENVHFVRIDADVNGSVREEASEEELKADTEKLGELFKKAVGKDKLTVKVEKLKDESISSVLTLSEEGRRMQDMMRMYSSGSSDMDLSMFAPDETLVLNANNELVRYLLDNPASEHAETFCSQLYDLAALSNRPLKAEDMTKFLQRSNEIMLLLSKK